MHAIHGTHGSNKQHEQQQWGWVSGGQKGGGEQNLDTSPPVKQPNQLRPQALHQHYVG